MKGNHLSLLDIVTRRWRTFVVTGTALSLLVSVGYWLQPLRYETYGIYRPKRTELRKTNKPNNSDLLEPLSFLDQILNPIFLDSDEVTPEARLIRDYESLQKTIEDLNLLDFEGNLASSRSLRRRIRLKSLDDGQTVKISLHGSDPPTEQRAVDRLMELYVQRFGSTSQNQAVIESLIQPQLSNADRLIKDTQQALYQIQLGTEGTPLAPETKAGDQTLDLQAIGINATQQLSTVESEIKRLQTELETAFSDRKSLLREIIALGEVREDVLTMLLMTLDQPRDSEQIQVLLNSLEAKALELKKNLTVSQTLYKNFLKEQTSSWVVTEEGKQSPITVVSAATTIKQGYRPRKPWFIGAALFVGLSGGIIASWLKEQQDDSFLSLADIYAYTKLPIFGVLPYFSHKSRKFQLLIRENGGHYPDATSAFNSSEHILEQFETASLGRIPKVLALTSTLRQEGTSLTTANLAYFLASRGLKVLIIDANLYHPQQHTLWNRPQTVGLCDCMSGEAQLGKTLQRLHANLDLLQAGYTQKNKDIVLNSPSMSLLVEELRTRYDHILIDTPSFDVSVHGYLIANSADASVLIVNPDKINFQQVQILKETEERTSRKLWGMIVNGSHQNTKKAKVNKLIQTSQWDASLRLQKQISNQDLELSTLSAINHQTPEDEENSQALDSREGRSRERQEAYLYQLPLEELHKLVDALWESWSQDLELLLEQEEEVVQQSRNVRELQEAIDQGNAYLKLSSELQLKEEKEKLDLLADTFIGQRPRLIEMAADLRLYFEVLLARTDAEKIPNLQSRNPIELL